MRCGDRGGWPEEVILGSAWPGSQLVQGVGDTLRRQGSVLQRGLPAGPPAARPEDRGISGLALPVLRRGNLRLARQSPAGAGGARAVRQGARPSPPEPTWTRARSSSKTRLKARSTLSSRTTWQSRPRSSGTMRWLARRPPRRMAVLGIMSIAPGPRSPRPYLVRTSMLDLAPGDPPHDRQIQKCGPRLRRRHPRPNRPRGRLRPPAGRRPPADGRRRRSIRGRGLDSRWRKPWPGQAIWRSREQLADSAAVLSSCSRASPCSHLAPSPGRPGDSAGEPSPGGPNWKDRGNRRAGGG